LNIERLKLGEIVPYKKNNRKHSELQIERIARSIQEFGFNQPICIDENNEILVGHGRLLAAQKLGLKDAPIVRLNDLTEEQKRAYRILDNKLQNDSEWDFDSLSEELDFLQSNGVDLESWGLDDLKSLFPEPEIEVSEDDGPGEVPKETYIKLGDLIELGKHRVLCGDSTKDDEVKELLRRDKPRIVVADPPYGINLESDWHTQTDKRPIIGDGSDWSPELIKTIFRNFKSCDDIFIWGADYFFEHIENRNEGSLLVWDKRSNSDNIGQLDGAIGSDFEICWSKQKHKRSIIRQLKETGVFANRGEDAPTGHPTQKPIPLIAKLILPYSEKGHAVIDPFLGSGTTLIAADQLNRICYGMEIEPKYCQVIIERYKKYCEQNGKNFECKINGKAFIPPSDEKEAL